jgi:hypothetical protein
LESVNTQPGRFVLAALSLLVVGIVLFRELAVDRYFLFHSDFNSYYQAALAVRHGSDPLAAAAAWIQRYQPGQPFIASYYVYTPFFAVLIIPFTLLPLGVAFVLWGLCNAAFLAGSIFGLLRASGMRYSWLSVLALTTLAALLPPVRFEFTWGQADIFVLFLVSAALWARGELHPFVAGVLLAVAAVTKPELLLITVFLLWKREWRFGLTALGAFPVLLLLPFTWLGGAALANQLAVWQFWSNTYLPFIDNQAPKGVLARLFTVNPSAHAVLVAPVVVTLGWLTVIAIVGLLALARISHAPLRRDVWSLLEMGLVVVALLLISPLTEYIYLTLLVLSMMSVYLWLRTVDRRSPPRARIAVGLAIVTLLVFLPLQRVEYFFWPRLSGHSPVVALYVLLGTPYLFLLVGYFALLFSTLGVVRGTTVRSDISTLFHASPRQPDRVVSRTDQPSYEAWRRHHSSSSYRTPSKSAVRIRRPISL